MHIHARSKVRQSEVSQSAGVAEDRFFEQHFRTPHRASGDTGGSSSAPLQHQAGGRNGALNARGVPRRGLSTHLEPPWAPSRLEQLLRAPSSPHLVPPERSKGLHHPPLDAPRALEGAARAPAQCPEGALRGCASLLGAPGGSKWVLKPLLGTPLAFRTPFCPPAWCCRWALAPDARGGVWKCCSKNLSSATPALCDTLLCHTLLRAWICTGSH